MAGLLVLAGFIALGLLLDVRVSNPLPVVVLAAGGAYAGWLLGVVVFGAVRGTDAGEQT
jgi:hypothetical protein